MALSVASSDQGGRRYHSKNSPVEDRSASNAKLADVLDDIESHDVSDLISELGLDDSTTLTRSQTVDDILNEDLDAATPSDLDYLDSLVIEPQSSTVNGEMLRLDAESTSEEPTALTPDSELRSTTSTTRTRSRQSGHDWKHPPRQSPKSGVLRLDRQRALSAQIQSASDRAHAGAPTCLAITQPLNSRDETSASKTLLAVGMSHGHVIVFDLVRQTMMFSLMVEQRRGGAVDIGAVSAMGFSRSGTKLAVGYSSGYLLIANIPKAKWILKLRPDQAHQPGRGVLHVSFTTTPDTIVLCDSGGSVFLLTISAGVTGLSHRLTCVFSGCHGEVCAIDALTMPSVGNINDAHFRHYADSTLIAMSSLTKAMVIQLAPGPKSVFAAPLPSDAPMMYKWPPIVRWQWLPIQISSKMRVTDPVLAICRQSNVQFFQLHTPDGKEWRHFPLSLMQHTYNIMQLHWLNTRCLIAIDDQECLHVFEAADPSYNPTGQSISKTAVEPTNQHRRRTYVSDSAHLTDVRLVYSSADFKGLATGGNVSPALACLADRACYHSVVSNMIGTCYILGLSGVYSVRIRSWIERLDVYLDAKDYINALQLAVDFYSGRLNTATALSTTQRNGALNNNNNSNDTRKRLIGDKVLEIVHLIVDWCVRDEKQQNANATQLEEQWKRHIPACIDACVTIDRRDVLYADIYERLQPCHIGRGLLLECLEDRLLDGFLPDIPPLIIQDYLTYLADESLLNSVEASIVRLPIESLDLHQVVTLCRRHQLWDGIIYVNNRALKDYVTPLKEMSALLMQVLAADDILTDEHVLLGNKMLFYINCCLCGRAYPIGSLDSDEAYVASRDVYHFLITSGTDNRDVTYPYLRMLLKFDMREFLNVCLMGFQSELFTNESGDKLLEQLIGVLVEVMSEGENNADMNVLHYSAFLVFLSRVVSERQHQLKLFIDKSRFQKIINVALRSAQQMSSSLTAVEDCQQAVIELTRTPSIVGLFDMQALAELADSPVLPTLREFMCHRNRQFSKLLDCYLESEYRASQVFMMVRRLLAQHGITGEEKQDIKLAIVDKLPLLTAVDATKTADLLLSHCEMLLPTLPDRFDKFEAHILVELLLQVFNQRKQSGLTTVTGVVELDVTYLLSCATALCKLEDTTLRLVRLFRDWHMLLDAQTGVPSKLMSICRAEHHVHGVLYLLEREQQYDQAFQYVINELRSTRTNLTDETTVPEFKLRNLISDLVHSMVMFVPADVVLDRLFGNASFNQCTYAEHRELIMNIVKSYEYEQVLLENVVRCLHAESFDIVRRGYRAQRHAFSVSRALPCTCVVCGVTVRVDANTGVGAATTDVSSDAHTTSKRRHVYAYSCGHVSHTTCVPHGSRDQCPVCNSTRSDVVEARLTQQQQQRAIQQSTTTRQQQQQRSVNYASARAYVQRSTMLLSDVDIDSHHNNTRSTIQHAHDPEVNDNLFNRPEFALRTAPARRINV